MEKILNILKPTSDSFDNVSILIQKKDVIKLVQDFVKDFAITSREFLALWIIYKFPKDVFGKKINKPLFEQTKLLFEKKDLSLLPTIISSFRTWKIQDNITLQNELFHKYHNMGVALFNLKNDESNEIVESKKFLQDCRKSVLENAFKIGGEEFVNKIKNYKPVVLNLHDLEKISEKAFWDMVQHKFENKNYEWVYVILKHILTLFKHICPPRTNEFEEIIDIPFIKQQVDHDAYTDMQNLTFKLLEIVETFQAPVHDEETRNLREQDFDLINLLYEIVSRSENILKLILKFKTN